MPSVSDDFRAAYDELEARMKRLAEQDECVYLPNVVPSSPVDYAFICMEPSLKGWARNAHHARQRVDAGFRNFIVSMQTTVLHFCIRQYLCAPTQTYHLTDISKGAMEGKRAAIGRRQRYDRWYPLLLQELEIVAKPEAMIFAVGREVRLHLMRRGFPRPITPILHYSPVAASHRASAIVGREREFEAFRRSVSLAQLVATADEVAPPQLRDETVAQVARRQLSDSLLMLMFTYKLLFENVRSP